MDFQKMRSFCFFKNWSSKFVRFCIVGSISALIDAVVFYIVNSFTIHQIALVCGYLCGLIFNYVLTVLWTFKVPPTVNNAIGVIIAHMVNLFVVRMGSMWCFVHLFGLSDRIAYIPTVIISVVINFIMVRFVINYTTPKDNYEDISH